MPKALPTPYDQNLGSFQSWDVPPLRLDFLSPIRPVFQIKLDSEDEKARRAADAARQRTCYRKRRANVDQKRERDQGSEPKHSDDRKGGNR